MFGDLIKLLHMMGLDIFLQVLMILVELLGLIYLAPKQMPSLFYNPFYLW